MIFAVGPLIALPATSGVTAITGAGAALSAARMPGSARIGSTLRYGFEGHRMIAATSAR